MAQSDSNNALSGLLSFISKISPGIFVALVVMSIGWIGSNSMQTNVTLAVMSADIIQLKEQIKTAGNDRYSNTQAISDRAYYLAEISHLKDAQLNVDARLLRAELRVLELERK